MRIGVFQFSPKWGDIGYNLAAISDTIFYYKGVELWVLPELCTTGYVFESKKDLEPLAEVFPSGKTSEAMEEVTRTSGTTVIMGVLEKLGENYFNSAAVFSKGFFMGIYRKIHLFNEEKHLFTPGFESPPVFRVKDVKIGVMICFDWIFPEVARTLALGGAMIIAHPANLVLPYCQDAMITRSIENRVFTVTANRVGTEQIGSKPPVTFTGKSQIVSPTGERLGALSENEENVLIVDIDPSEALDKNITKLNNLFEDRNPDVYKL